MMSDIEDVQYADSAENGCVDVRIKTAQDVDIRENIFYRMAELQCPILKMQYSSLSLEDVFLELTEDQKLKKIQKLRRILLKKMIQRSFLKKNFRRIRRKKKI